MKNLTEQEYIDKLKSEDIDFNSIPKKFRTENVCLAAVMINGLDLKRVENQTDEMCLAAVRQNGWALNYVKDQTEEICLAAVNEDGSALQFVENQTDEICLAAVKNRVVSLKYVKKQTENIYKQAFKINAISFIYVDAGIYKYNKNDIKKAFKNINPRLSELRLILLNKIHEVLNNLNNEKLVDAVNKDLKEIFTEENIKLYKDLFNIKSKADMIAGLGNNGKINIVDKKPKII